MILKKIRLMDAKNPVRNAQAAFADRVYSASAASVLFRILGRDHFFRTVGFLSIIALVDFIVIDIVEIIRIWQVARIIRINLNVEVFNFAFVLFARTVDAANGRERVVGHADEDVAHRIAAAFRHFARTRTHDFAAVESSMMSSSGFTITPLTGAPFFSITRIAITPLPPRLRSG